MALAPLTRRRWRAGLASALLLGALGCDESTGAVCTGEFAVITVKVLEPGGDPLENATTIASVVRTGEVLPSSSLILLEPGVYAVVDDSHLPRLRRTGDAIRFQATAAPLFATAEFTISTLGGCHVTKASGPETIEARFLED